MALFSECMLRCGRKVLDSVSIVREAMFRQLMMLWDSGACIALATWLCSTEIEQDAV